MASIVLKNINKIYPIEDGKQNALSKAVTDFNIEISDKEFVVLVGPSGCGKSTTLRMIAGLEDITEGELYMDGKLVNHLLPKDRNIAMVFQNYAIYPHMTVYENMAFGLKIRKIDKKTIDTKIKEAAEILGLTPLLQRKPSTLSGGERQRVAIGRAIVREPDVFLFDEPLSNLDAKLREQMRAEIIKLRQRIKTTFIYVTHDQTEAMTLGDRVVIMKDGLIEQVGTPHEVFNEPVNMFVAEFIGTPQMNFFPARLCVNKNQYVVEVYNKMFVLSPYLQEKMRRKGLKEKDIFLGIRPEDILLSDSEEAICANVDFYEMMGSELHLHILMNGQNAVVKVQSKDEFFRKVLKGEESIQVTLSVDKLHLFDSKTKANLIFD